MNTERITTMLDNGPPPQAAATLYPGEVMHQRLKPFGHRFVYRVFSLLVDIDRLDEVDRTSPLLSVNRPNFVSFHEADQTGSEDETLRQFADRLLARAGIPSSADRILLLSYPRIFGYAFNPISVYFAYDEAGKLLALIYAVRNTFGERHTYVARIEPSDLTEAGIRQTRAKLFHVSPFIGMDARYHFRILPPGRAIRLRIHETETGQPVLAATFTGKAQVLSTQSLVANLLRFPLMTWKIMAGIHWEALKLRLKGARFHKSPPAPHPVSFGDARKDLAPGE